MTSQSSGADAVAALAALSEKAGTKGYELAQVRMVRGRSGVNHFFSLLLKSGKWRYGFDIYDGELGQIELMRTHIKRFDTRVPARIVYTSAHPPSLDTIKLARSYGLSIFSIEQLDEALAELHTGPGSINYPTPRATGRRHA